MPDIDESSSITPPSRIFRIGRFFVRGIWNVVKLLALLWATLAIYYSNLPWDTARLTLATAFSFIGLWALWITKKPKIHRAFAGLFLVVVVWFSSISPTHDRIWAREVAAMPRAIIEGDRIRIIGVRDFFYRQWNEFDANYHEREVDLSDLTSIDFFVSYWKDGPIAHTFLSFNFDNAPPVCVSIEVRNEEHEGFAPIASIFKQFELIYLVGEERDLVRTRTNFRNEDVYLYRLRTKPEDARNLFLIYLKRINELAENPEWYHLLKSNCTLNIIRYKKEMRGSGRYDYRHLVNGWVDRYLYETGLLDNSISFRELRKKSLINEVAKETGDDISALEFARRIRQGLPMIDSNE